MLGAARVGLISNKQVGDALDTYFKHVALLLNGAGASGGTTFTDLSDSGLVITANGDVETNGSGKIYFDGAGDYLESAGIDLNYDDYEVRLKVMFSSVADTTILDEYAGAGTNTQFILDYVGGSLRWTVYGGSIETVQRAWTPVVDTEYPITVRHISGYTYIYVEEELLVAGFQGSPSPENPKTLQIGGTTGSRWLNGYMDDIRITVGASRDERAADSVIVTDLPAQANLVGFWDMGNSDCYDPGVSTTVINNLEPTPADGQSQAVYNLAKSTATFVGTAGAQDHNTYMDVPEATTLDVTTATSLTNRLHWSNQPWTILMVSDDDWQVSTGTIATTLSSGTASNRGFLAHKSGWQVITVSGYPSATSLPSYKGVNITGWIADGTGAANSMQHCLNGVITPSVHGSWTDTTSTADQKLVFCDDLGGTLTSYQHVYAIAFWDRALSQAEVSEFTALFAGRVGITQAAQEGDFPTAASSDAFAGWSASVQCEAWSRRAKTAYRVGGPGAYGKIRYEKAITAGDGKKQFELKVLSGSANFHAGVVNQLWTAPTTNGLGYDSNAWAVLINNTYNAGVTTPITFPISDGTVVGIIVDPDTKEVWFSRNGVWQGDPEAGTGAAFVMTGTSWYPALYHAYSGQMSEIHSTEAEFEYPLLSVATALE